MYNPKNVKLREETVSPADNLTERNKSTYVESTRKDKDVKQMKETMKQKGNEADKQKVVLVKEQQDIKEKLEEKVKVMKKRVKEQRVASKWRRRWQTVQ